MPDDVAGTQFRQLAPVGTDIVDTGRLAELYAYPDGLQACWVRANMIATLDGGATDHGKTGGLAGPGDRTIFQLLRHLADVIVVGAATVRIESYAGAQLSVAQRQARQRRGQAEIPPIAVVTQTGNLDPDALIFTRTEVAPLILTCTQAFDQTRHHLGPVAEVVDASGPRADHVDGATMCTILAERKLLRVLAEGGPQTLGMLIDDDVLDELCLTVAPILVGGIARRIATGPGQVHTPMRRAHLLTDDAGYLYTRYVCD